MIALPGEASSAAWPATCGVAGLQYFSLLFAGGVAAPEDLWAAFERVGWDVS